MDCVCVDRMNYLRFVKNICTDPSRRTLRSTFSPGGKGGALKTNQITVGQLYRQCCVGSDLRTYYEVTHLSLNSGCKLDKRNANGSRTSGRGLHEMGKGSVRAAIASERYLSDVEVKLHNMHVQDQVFITKNDEHVDEISMKQ